MDKDYQLNVSISKALSPSEAPLKIKHARSIIIATHRSRSVQNFWAIIIRQPLMENRFIAWKFCHILHKVLREGHEDAIKQSQTHKTLILEVGKLWGHLQDGVGKCIELYTKLLVNKLEFHQKNSCFSGSLILDFNEVVKMAGDDLNIYFQLCVEVFDYLDHIVQVQSQIFVSVNTYRMSSMTPQGQCRLAPLITLIQDSNPLYDVCVRLMFRLHDGLQHDVLIGHRSRFIDIFSKLKLFYENVRPLQYFSDVIQLPYLPENAPNFSSEVDLGNYITPVMVLEQEHEPSMQSLVDLTNKMENFTYSVAEENILEEKNLIIRELQDRLEEKQMELERYSDLANEVTNCKIKNESIELEMATTKEILKHTSHLKDNLELKLSEMSAMEGDVKKSNEKVKQVEDKFNKIKTMYSKLREEHINLLRMRNEDSKQLDYEIKKNHELKTEIECLKKKDDIFEKNTEINYSLKSKTIEYEKVIDKLSLDLNNSKLVMDQSKEDKIAITHQYESKLKEHFLESEQIKHKLEQEQYQKNDILRIKSEQDLYIQKLELILKNTSEEKHIIELELKKKNNQLDTYIEKDIKAKIDNDSIIKSVIKSIVYSLRSYSTLNSFNDEIVHEYGEKKIETIKSKLQTITEEYEICLDNNKQKDNFVSSCVELFSTLRTLNEYIKFIFNKTTNMEKAQDLRNMSNAFYESILNFYELLLVENNMSDINETYGNDIVVKLNDLQKLLALLRNSFDENLNIADMLQQELKYMDKIIEEAAKRMMEMHFNSKLNNDGIKLEVNEKIIDSCTSLMQCIIVLIKKSRDLQEEIVIHGKGTFTEKEFYKRNSQWTEGLISASKSVAKGANFLVDAADKSIVLESNECFEIIVAAQEIAASTAQLVIASRVKANQDSRNLIDLINASRDVSMATGLVVATVKDGCNKLEYRNEIDTTKLTTSQKKAMEMEMHIKVLQLEQALDNERQNLMTFRKKFYQSSDD